MMQELLSAPVQNARLPLRCIDRAVEREIAYAKDWLPSGVLSLTADFFRDCVRYFTARIASVSRARGVRTFSSAG